MRKEKKVHKQKSVQVESMLVGDLLHLPSDGDVFFIKCLHTIYTINNMGQKCEGSCGLWDLNEILKKTYPENLKKILGAVWELPAK